MNSLANLPSIRQCHKKLYKIVWGDYSCPDGCGTRVKFRDTYEYCPKCRKKFSVKSETFFKYSNLSIKQVWALIWCWQHKCSIGETKNLLLLSYPTIRRWFKKFRTVLPQERQKITGVAEVDESYIGKKKYGRQQLIMGGINPLLNKVRLGIIPNRERASIENFILETVETGANIISDGWYSYNEIASLGYDWDSCNHSLGEFGPTNHIENVWSVIKRHLRHLYRDLSFSVDDLKLILKEWEHRYNNAYLFYTVEDYLQDLACSRLVQ